MAIAWEGDKILGIQLPEDSDKQLLEAMQKRLQRTDISWNQNPPLYVTELAEQICLHLKGKPQKFSTSHLDLEKITPFFRKIYLKAVEIPPGKVRTYTQLAVKAGSPRASRAVGQAMARNPFPLVVPCHRVVGAGKNPGGFSAHGGLKTKSLLLEIENSKIKIHAPNKP